MILLQNRFVNSIRDDIIYKYIKTMFSKKLILLVRQLTISEAQTSLNLKTKYIF